MKTEHEIMTEYIARLRKREKYLTEERKSINAGLIAIRELIATEETALANAKKDKS